MISGPHYQKNIESGPNVESDPNNTCVAYLPSCFRIRHGKSRLKVWISVAHGSNKRLSVRKYGQGASDVHVDVARDCVGWRGNMGGHPCRSQKCGAVE